MDSLRDRLRASHGATYVVEREFTGGRLSRVFLAEETRFKQKRIARLERSNRGERKAHG